MNGKVAKAIRKVVYRNGCHKDERTYKSFIWKFRHDTGKRDENDKPICDIVLRNTIFNVPASPRAYYQMLKKEYKKRFQKGEKHIYSKIVHSLKNANRRNAPVAECA